VTASPMQRFSSLFEAPSPAVLTTYRKDGGAATSPVWFRFRDSCFEVVIAENDVKLRHLAAHPRCSLVVFETVPPFRGIRVEDAPDLCRDGAAEARLSIAGRYLGPELAQRFAAQRATPGVLLRLSARHARSWDLAAIIPQ
jgi:Pyridoxamine 5'-phosphate oxidase